ncbi:zinc finger protein 177-like [Notolabrus celidotus]|uniref:zinc finger protein 177-like n=1 Tax=Notolabrus celidotus TaxID=1203425 RepID=UPI00148F8B1C|nr:zinc finger protein 177-like [Notolabrus celidotus]
MFQLRSFVHQRLYAAAEEILGEVEKTITLALHEARTQRPKQDPDAQHPKPDCLQQISEPQLTTGALNKEGELPENLAHPSTQEESDLNEAEVQYPAQTTAGRGFVQIDFGLKVEQEEHGEDSEIQEVIFPPVEVVKCEQDQPEANISDEMQPVSSDCSEAEIDGNGSDEEWAQNKGAKMNVKKQKPDGNTSARSIKDLLVCPTCGKGFQYIRPLMKHITTHKKTNESNEELLNNLQSAYKTVCDFCGKKFASAGCLKTHSKIHTGVRDYRCQDCGKTFIQKGHLTVHIRTHSGERPYYCEFCGRAFSQKQNLSAHERRIHMGEMQNQCGSERKQVLCGVSRKRHKSFL